MQNRMTSRRRKPARAPGTVAAQGETTVQKRVERLPHEHDESSDSQTHGEPSGKRMGEQAHRDVRAGMVDTDRGPVMERTYERVKRGA